MAVLTHHFDHNWQHSVMNKIKTKEELRAMRKQMFEEMEEKLRAGKSPEDSLFYYYPSEDRIVLSHALFWMMHYNELKAYVAVHHHYTKMFTFILKIL